MKDCMASSLDAKVCFLLAGIYHLSYVVLFLPAYITRWTEPSLIEVNEVDRVLSIQMQEHISKKQEEHDLVHRASEQHLSTLSAADLANTSQDHTEVIRRSAKTPFAVDDDSVGGTSFEDEEYCAKKSTVQVRDTDNPIHDEDMGE